MRKLAVNRHCELREAICELYRQGDKINQNSFATFFAGSLKLITTDCFVPRNDAVRNFKNQKISICKQNPN